MRRPSRRHFLQASAWGAGALPILGASRLLAAQADPFRHGVASGDPLSDRVILWTRVTTAASGPVEVSWVVARDPALQQTVGRGTTRTTAARDHTVKVDARGLSAGTTYYYAFRVGGAQSPIGRTRTLPAGRADRLRLGIASCSNLPFGYFNAYGRLADRLDLDAVIHLGDYIYEYRNGQYGDGARYQRVPDPNREIVALEHYRTRHAQYKLDVDLQAVHRQHPFIAVWDDHELTNNTWRDGAENHDPDQGEGPWPPRRDAAIQAYYEWMPIREGQGGRQLYRRFTFGDLADLIMIDTRLVGRDEPVEAREDIAAIEAPTRSLIGRSQEERLARDLRRSASDGRLWQLLGQQVMFAPQVPPGQPSSNTDSWDGYRAARERVYDMVTAARVPNFVVLTGDVHSSWAYDLPRRPFDDYDPVTGRGSLGVEIVGTSVTSPSGVGAGPNGEQQLAELRASRPHLKYVDGRYRGYVVLDITRARLQADYYAVTTIEERSTDERFVRGFVSEVGSRRLVGTETVVRSKKSEVRSQK